MPSPISFINFLKNLKHLSEKDKSSLLYSLTELNSCLSNRNIEDFLTVLDENGNRTDFLIDPFDLKSIYHYENKILKFSFYAKDEDISLYTENEELIVEISNLDYYIKVSNNNIRVDNKLLLNMSLLEVTEEGYYFSNTLYMSDDIHVYYLAKTDPDKFMFAFIIFRENISNIGVELSKGIKVHRELLQI